MAHWLRLAGRMALLALKAPVPLIRARWHYARFSRSFRRAAQSCGMPDHIAKDLCRDLHPMRLLRAASGHARSAGSNRPR